MNKSPLALAVVVVTTGLSGLSANPVQAQKESFALEEVIVTARKREESMQDVPVAVSSFGAEELGAYNMTQTMDIAAFTPGMFTEPAAANNLSGVKTTIRGQVQADTLSTLDPSVGWYVDDIYLARVTGTAGSIFDLARIEVLKGPQGTLYGRNTTGGAVRIITNKADPTDELSGFITASAGNHGLLKYGGAINIPVIEDKLAIRLTALSDELDDGIGSVTVVPNPAGFLYPDNNVINVPGGKKDAGVRDSELYRLGVTWTPTDRLAVSMMYQYDDYYANAILLNTKDAPAFGYSAPKDLYSGGTVNNLQEAWAESDMFSLTVEYEFSDNLRTKFVYGYRDLESEFISDVDGTPIPLNYFLEPFEQNSEQQSIEWQLGGELFDSRLEWLAGIYLFEEEGIDFSNSNGASSLPAVLGGTYNGTIDQNESDSIFANATFHITDALSLTGGLRYTEDTKPISTNAEQLLITGQSVCRFDLETVPNPDPVNCTWGAEDDFDYTSWTISLDWAVSDDVLLYAKSSRGYRAGGQNLRGLGDAEVTDSSGNVSIVSTNAPFDEEEVTDFELGMKGQFFDRSLQLNVAAYVLDYTDLQRSLLLQTSKGLTTFVENQSDAEFQGVELEAKWVVTSNFLLSGTANWFDYDFDERGEYAHGTPEEEFTLRANYLIPLSASDISLDVNFSYRGEVLPNSSATEQDLRSAGYQVDSVELWGARAAWDMHNGFGVALWGRNLADEEYVLSGLTIGPPSLGVLSGGLGEPRSYGVDLTYHF